MILFTNSSDVALMNRFLRSQFNLWVVLIVTPAKKGCPTGRDCALIMKLGMIRNIFRKFEIIKVTDAICIHYCPELKGVFEMVILG